MKVLISDSLSPEGVEILKKGGLDVTVKTGMTPDELKGIIGEFDGLVIRSATKVTADLVDAAKNLKVIGRAGSGLDNVDKVAASKRGIVVMNTPGGNTVTTAEHALSMMMSLARNIPQATASLKAGKWEKKKIRGRRTLPEDAGRTRHGRHRLPGGKEGAGAWDDRAGVRPVPFAGEGGNRWASNHATLNASTPARIS